MEHLPATSNHAPVIDPIQALRLGVRTRRESPLNDQVWRWGLLLTMGSLLVLAVGRLPESWATGRGWLLFLLATPTWLLAVRLLFADTRWRRFWRVWLILGALGIPFSGDHIAGRVIAVTFGLVFLVLRRYRPYRHLNSARRAKLFGLGCLAWVGLMALGGAPDPHGWLQGVAFHTAKTAVILLWFFWLLTLINLFLGMRLHFLRLRPKLAVAGLLIAIVPLTLAIALALVGVYGAMGGSRASQARALLSDWAEAVDREPASGVRLFGEPMLLDASSAGSSAPSWMIEMRRAAETSRWDSPDTTLFVAAAGRVWLLRARGLGQPEALLWAFAVDEEFMEHLAALLQCDVSLHASHNVEVTDDGGVNIRVSSDGRGDEDPNGTDETEADDSASDRLDIVLQGRYPASADSVSGEQPFWHRPLHFGGATLELQRLSDGRLGPHTVLLGLKVSLAGLIGTYLDEENEINRAVVVALTVLAALFLLMEIVALFFGLRITTGITSAVRALHRGTERLAQGELDAHIEIPNEDEFGDLAASFNEMTAAVKLGQEQALQRERLEQEVLMARRIQERLLPREMPEIANVQIAGSSLPSRHVGGDYFDFLSLADGRLGVAVGDVTGKGIPAALLMATLQACLHGQAIHPSSVAEVVGRVNDLMAASTDAHMFATFVYAVLDPDGSGLTVTNAGHEPPILCRANGEIERLREGGLVLGMLPAQTYSQEQVDLMPGDVLVFYSDGITEAMGPVEGGLPPGAEVGGRAADLPVPAAEALDPDEDEVNFFGEERLIDVILATAAAGAEEIREAILAAVSAHTRGIPQSDDITLVVMKRA